MNFRLVSFNVQYRRTESVANLRSRMAEIAEFLREREADALCLQEVVPEAYPILLERLHPQKAIFYPREDGRENGEGVPILLTGERFSAFHSDRFWLSATPDEPSIGWKARCHRMAGVLGIQNQENPENRLWLINLHLDHKSKEARKQSLALLKSRLATYDPREKDPILLCGDFNMRPRDPVFAHLYDGKPGFRDAAQSDPQAGSSPTFHGWSPLRLGRGRLDYCFHSPRINCAGYTVYPAVARGRRLSDHNLVQADFAV